MFGFFKKKQSNEDQSSKIASIEKGDATLEEFKKRAQQDLQYLIDFMNEHEQNDELFQYAVKTNFIEEGNSEHMWVQVYKFNDGKFTGRLANEPRTVKLLKYGDYVSVAREDVEDWVLQDHLTHTKVGGFSSGYIRNKSKQS
ncbi:DUF2314 domain-containing protein [Mucilaginibacter gotjawali]|uniref:Uncharacterized protein YegJ (DUF2314 family) n=2 Tax=Mucilaginibacter gotjawali TaxID=1550579 RepID=A0A839SCU4_9SPHI|nr:DUF2314 domain-containing protein [Mucilaginibacter gotjawali]MBB3055132.1 uncharacterized protein YegJ (DUF2314 family) [Mucilaginibacter gotjawali]BAU56249.1 hypothetical protein MgSA37_04446 [Mucilaginibacter gotjawali]